MNAVQQIAITAPAIHPRERETTVKRHIASFVVSGLDSMHRIAAELRPGSYVLDPIRLNDHYDLYKHLIDINAQLENGQCYIGRVDHVTGYEHSENRDKHITFSKWKKYTRFLIHRVLPKLSITTSFYRYFTGGRNRRISKTEALGRLKHAGFDILETKQSRTELIFLVQKKSPPLTDSEPYYGALVRFQRIVKHGRKAGIFKFRTMYPYAEYIQDYVYEQNDLATGGKIKDDFRITVEGRFMRKYFIDELPMLINLLNGDIKLVGVRPLSSHYFSLYTDNMQTKRLKHKPGLLPPYYSEKNKPETLEEIMVSEIRYLFMFERNPIKTEVKYFFRIVSNIIGYRLWSS